MCDCKTRPVFLVSAVYTRICRACEEARRTHLSNLVRPAVVLGWQGFPPDGKRGWRLHDLRTVLYLFLNALCGAGGYVPGKTPVILQSGCERLDAADYNFF